MKYYLHDSNSFNDEKVTELYIAYGYEGLGLFYTLLEKLAGQEKPIKTKVLKAQLKVGKKLNKCWKFMESIGIIHSNNGETFNKQLLNFSEKYQIKKEKNTKRISEWRKNQHNIENVTSLETVSNTPKDNISKVNESKVNYLRLRDKIYEIPVSEYMKKNEAIFLDQWGMQNKSFPVEKVLEQMDKDFICYDFNNENHIKNSFKSSAKKIMDGKPERKDIKDRF